MLWLRIKLGGVWVRALLIFWHDRWLDASTLTDTVPLRDSPHMLLAEFYGTGGWNVERLKEWLLVALVASRDARESSCSRVACEQLGQ